MTNGGVVTGELVRETPKEVVLRWDYGEVGFQRAEIARIVKEVPSIEGDGLTMPWEGQQERWPYQHDVVAKLKKGTVVDAKLTTVTPETLILTQALAGGGEVKHTIRRDDPEDNPRVNPPPRTDVRGFHQCPAGLHAIPPRADDRPRGVLVWG